MAISTYWVCPDCHSGVSENTASATRCLQDACLMLVMRGEH